jgi:hypothetical protein
VIRSFLRAPFALCLLLAAPAWAHPGDEQGHGRGRDEVAHEGHPRGPAPVPAGVSVPNWSQLSPEQQAKLAELAPHWDQMPASRRVRALERLERKARWEAMTPEQREKLREGARNFRDLPPELREKMRISMATLRQLPEGERKELFRLWRGLDPAQRRAWLEQGGPGISPPPEVAPADRPPPAR